MLKPIKLKNLKKLCPIWVKIEDEDMWWIAHVWKTKQAEACCTTLYVNELHAYEDKMTQSANTHITIVNKTNRVYPCTLEQFKIEMI